MKLNRILLVLVMVGLLMLATGSASAQGEITPETVAQFRGMAIEVATISIMNFEGEVLDSGLLLAGSIAHFANTLEASLPLP